MDMNLKFPSIFPDMAITKLNNISFEVNCPELRWWFLVPEKGQSCDWGTFNYPTRTLSSLTNMRVAGKTRLHGIDCYEILVTEWTCEKAHMKIERTFYARLTDEYVQWMGHVYISKDGTRNISTFLDEDFLHDWLAADHKGDYRLIWDEGRYQELEDGSLIDTDRKRSIGSGYYKIDMNHRSFECLRVIEPNYDGKILVEAYITREGETVLFRRYNEKSWSVGSGQIYTEPWDVMYPQNNIIMLDGLTYVHWYDCLTDKCFD